MKLLKKFRFFPPSFIEALVQYVHLSVGFSHTLKFILLLDSIAVGASFGSVDELISQTLGNRFDVTERGLTSTGAQKPDSLIDASER